MESYSQDIPGFTLLSCRIDSAQVLAGNPGYSLLFTSGDNETGDGITLTKEIGTIIADTDMGVRCSVCRKHKSILIV